MSGIIYGLCALTALWCGGLLLRAYARTRYRLLLWSGICFFGLSANNMMLVVDRILVPSLDMTLLRLLPALIGMLVLMYGLVWESD